MKQIGAERLVMLQLTNDVREGGVAAARETGV
jgi:hypothetical protein